MNGNSTSIAGHDYPRHTTAIHLFEAQATSVPEARAAVCGTLALTYRQLQEQVNRMAHRFQEKGVRPGDYVGICLERSIEMLTAVLAASKLGAVYVPLDPNFPRDRLEFMAMDCNLSAIVTHSQTSDVVDVAACRIDLDCERSGSMQSAESRLATAARPEGTAYILYTSGSTGKPKGVKITHRALVNLLWSMRSTPGIRQDDILLAITTLSFDIAALELFLPLIAGACVHIATSEEAKDPKRLSQLIASSRATILQATPIQWRMLVESGWKGQAGFKILCGGEPLRPQLASALTARGEVWNMYGPTETTIWSSVCLIRPGTERITVGWPIANTFFYVLSETMQEAATGEKGELYIGGDGVADGYLNRPDLTAEKFVPDVFRGGDARMYRTGDIAARLEDGATEVFGRTDSQVKVRGFRIEPGEIESALSRCPLVRENAVVVREEASGEHALVAFVVASSHAGDIVAEVRSFLSGMIPAYMVPGHIVLLEGMPQLPNGKIDRKTLPSLQAIQHGAAVVTEDGRDELERKLLNIWAEVLHVAHLNRNSNFFEMGGRSVLAARLFTQIDEQLGQSLPLATLLQAPTVAELAAVIRDTGWRPPWGSLVPIRPQGSKPPLFLVHAIGGNIVNFQAFASRFDSDQPVYGLQARGLDGKEAPHASVEEMASDYIRSIRSVQNEGPYLLGGFSAGGVVAYEMARQLLEAGQETRVLALLDTQIQVRAELPRRAGALEGLDRWRRMLAFNFRYALRTGLKGFTRHKLRNWRMRMHIRTTGFGMGRLDPEEAFLLALRRYRPEPYNGAALLFRAKNELVRYPDPTFGWKPLIRGELQISEVAGDHDTLLDEPYIGALACELNWRLTQDSREHSVVGSR